MQLIMFFLHPIFLPTDDDELARTEDMLNHMHKMMQALTERRQVRQPASMQYINKFLVFIHDSRATLSILFFGLHAGTPELAFEATIALACSSFESLSSSPPHGSCKAVVGEWG